jgi:hypothetical protein
MALAFAAPMATAGVTAGAIIPASGHGFAYWGKVHERVIAFLRASTSGG